MEYIRTYYNVPAKKGGIVKYNGQEGKITGSRGPYLLIKLVGAKKSTPFHPTYLIEYL